MNILFPIEDPGRLQAFIDRLDDDSATSGMHFRRSERKMLLQELFGRNPCTVPSDQGIDKVDMFR